MFRRCRAGYPGPKPLGWRNAHTRGCLVRWFGGERNARSVGRPHRRVIDHGIKRQLQDAGGLILDWRRYSNRVWVGLWAGVFLRHEADGESDQARDTSREKRDHTLGGELARIGEAIRSAENPDHADVAGAEI